MSGSDTSDIVVTDFSGEIGTIGLNRPERRNAMNAEMIAKLLAAFTEAAETPSVRAVILSGSGQSFCAGGDISWMKTTGTEADDANTRDAGGLADMLLSIRNCPKPVIAVVHGPTMGGGVGLTACADIALAAKDALFAFSEVRLGLTPATISPFVIEAIGARWARRLFQTGERFTADIARRIGLIQDYYDDLQLAHIKAYELAMLVCQAGPTAVRDAKSLVLDFAGRPIDRELLSDAASRIAQRRASAEGQEGTRAFLEKRRPSWQSDKDG